MPVDAAQGKTLSEVCRKYLRLQMTDEVGPIRLRKLIDHFGGVDAVLSASISELEQVSGIGEKTAVAIFGSRNNAELVEHEIQRAAQCNVQMLCPEDDGYPKALTHIPDPPICLYVRGELKPEDAVAVAIVGTRRCSHYGSEQATRFGELLAQAGFTVVSGLARGIDGHAHQGALRAAGRTIAVLGNGLSSIYPPEHESLAREIQTSGAIVSELPIDAPPDSKNFPGRNRIIAGLSLGVLVVEAGQRSGALITARLAGEYNREAFAIPGRLDRPDLSVGVNALIRDGAAKLVTCLEDILDELGEVGEIMRGGSNGRIPAGSGGDSGSRQRPLQLSKLSDEQKEIYQAVVEGASDVDEVCFATARDAGFVASSLTTLQLVGLLRQLPGGRFEVRDAGIPGCES